MREECNEALQVDFECLVLAMMIGALLPAGVVYGRWGVLAVLSLGSLLWAIGRTLKVKEVQ